MARNVASVHYPQPSLEVIQPVDLNREDVAQGRWHEDCISKGVPMPPTAAEQPSQTSMDATSHAISQTPTAGAAPAAQRPGLLGAVALLLWMAAVCLGIIAPLSGIRVDMTVVVAVLVASGIASLLSLPAAAGFLGRRGAASNSARDPTHRT